MFCTFVNTVLYLCHVQCTYHVCTLYSVIHTCTVYNIYTIYICCTVHTCLIFYKHWISFHVDTNYLLIIFPPIYRPPFPVVHMWRKVTLHKTFLLQSQLHDGSTLRNCTIYIDAEHRF